MTDDDKPKDDRPFHVRMAEMYRANRPPRDNGPKLTRQARCEAYALLYIGEYPVVVSRLFGLSRATVSHIGGCRDDDRRPTTIEVAGYSETIGGPNINRRQEGRRTRYPEIAREFETLGEDEFLRRYLSPGLHQRVAAIRAQIREELKQKKQKKGKRS